MENERAIELTDTQVLQITKPFIEQYSEKIKRLEEENKVLLEDAKKVADEELRKENAELKKRLELSYGQFSSEKELKAFNAFVKKHTNCMTKHKGDGGKVPYVIPYGTGIGTCVTVVCPVCGEKKEITDSSVW